MQWEFHCLFWSLMHLAGIKLINQTPTIGQQFSDKSGDQVNLYFIM